MFKFLGVMVLVLTICSLSLATYIASGSVIAALTILAVPAAIWAWRSKGDDKSKAR